MTKKHLLLTGLFFLAMASIQAQFITIKPGLEYLIITNGEGEKIKQGDFFETQIGQVYNGKEKDSVLYDSRQHSNQIAAFDSTAMPPDYFVIFSQVRKGDSVVTRILTDSIMSSGNFPPFIEKGQHITGHYKIIHIFKDKQSADSAFRVNSEQERIKDSIESAGQLLMDKKMIESYLEKNNIKTIRAPQGTYVQIINPGAGELIGKNKEVKVYYTGNSIVSGKIFDSNIDSSFGHTTVLSFITASGSVMKGWEDGFSLLRKGAEAWLYIPSVLAYGKAGTGSAIGPNENLSFYVKVVNVLPVNQSRKNAKPTVPVKKTKKKK
jgi:FKBP-type peptidyl-prolyl cis-trans isomerase FkpA